MKKCLKIFAFCFAIIGLGCIGLAGCGSSGKTVSTDSFTTFYGASTTTNEIASTVNYTFSYEDRYGKVVTGQYEYVDAETYYIKMTVTEDGDTKIKGVDDYDYGQANSYDIAIGKCKTASYYVSTVLGTGASAYADYTTIKLKEEDLTSTYTITTTVNTNGSATASYEFKATLTYETDAEGNSQIVSVSAEETQSGTTTTRSIAVTDATITFPSDLTSWTEA